MHRARTACKAGLPLAHAARNLSAVGAADFDLLAALPPCGVNRRNGEPDLRWRQLIYVRRTSSKSLDLVTMILSFRDKRTEIFAKGERVRAFQGFDRQG